MTKRKGDLFLKIPCVKEKQLLPNCFGQSHIEEARCNVLLLQGLGRGRGTLGAGGERRPKKKTASLFLGD